MKGNRTTIPPSARLLPAALLIACLFCGLSQAAFAQFQINYAEALQKSIYFYDAQRSGVLPPYGYAPGQNRVRWLTSHHTYDGYDLQLPPGGMWNGFGDHITDANKAGALQGGFRDAGDHPKWASSIGFATCMLAWSGLEQYNEFFSTGQLPYLLENVKWGTDYMLRSFLYTDINDPSTYRIIAIVSDYRAEHINPNAASNLLVHRVPQRPHYYFDKDAPNTPHIAKYAAAMATASILFRKAGNTAYADLLYDRALRLHDFMAQYRGSGTFKRADGVIINAEWRLNQAYFDAFVNTPNFPAGTFGPDRMPERIDFTQFPNMATRVGGSSPTFCPDYITPKTSFSPPPPSHNHFLPNAVQTDWGNYMYYNARSAAEMLRIISDELAYAHIWMHLAEVEKNGNTPLATFHLNKAVNFFENVFTDISSGGVAGCSSSVSTPPSPRQVHPLRGPGYMNYDSFAALLLNRLIPSDPRYRQALETLVDFIISRPTSPGGLTYVMGGPWDTFPQGGSSSDPFEAWGVFEQLTPRMWLALCFAKDIPNAVKKQQYISWAESQVSYIFCNNPQRRNFFIGMPIPGCNNDDWALHSNALGSWGGNDERIPTTISYTPQNRNRLIGGLIGGPRWDDTRPNSISDPARYTEVATFYQPCFTGVLANMITRHGGTPLPPDFPKEFLPDFDGDGQGDDVPDPVPSNSFWSCMEFPVHARQEDVPRDMSDNQVAPTAARRCEVRITVNNRSRWAPRGLTTASVRYYFTLEPGVTVDELRLRNPFWAITGVPNSERDLHGDADGATFESNTDGVTLLTGAAAMAKVNVVATDATGHKLCYVEIFFRNPTSAAMNYLFDTPVPQSLPQPPAPHRPPPRITLNPLQTAQNFLLGITPAAPDLNLIWPGGPYPVKNPIGWAKRHELRHAVLRITFSANSDLTNDWSYALLPARTAYTIPNGGPANARFIPFYENGVLLCGDIPTTPTQVPPTPPPPPMPNHDYVKALQRSIYYFETQRSGQVSAGVTLPNGTPLPNRVEWRGDSHTASSTDGGDLFPTIDLVGGLYEGGMDFTKTSVSMAHAASMMAWSYLDYPNVYNNHPELRDRMLGNLKWISDYFLKSFTATNPNDESTYRIYLFVTDRLADGSSYANNTIPNGAASVNTTNGLNVGPAYDVREWAAAEVIHQLPASRRPERRFFYADKDAPYVSHVASIAGALAAASRTFRAVGGMDAYAEDLLTAARRLYNFCFRYTHGSDKMLNYTTLNFATPEMTGGSVTNGNVFGVAKDMSGNLVRIEPFDADFNPANGIQVVTDGTGNRFEPGGSGNITGNTYNPPVPDYYEYLGPPYSETDNRILRWIHDNMAWAAIWVHLAEQAKTTPNLNGPSGQTLLREAGAYARNFLSNAAGEVFNHGRDILGSPVDYTIPATLLLFKLQAPFPPNATAIGSYRNALRHFFMGGGSNAAADIPSGVTPNTPVNNRILSNPTQYGSNGLFNFTGSRLRSNGSLRPVIEASLACLAFARYIDLNIAGQTPPSAVITPSVTGYTATWGDLRDQLLEVGKRNIDAILGSNSRRLSYMYGYHSDEIPGLEQVNGLKYIAHLTASGFFAGTSHLIPSASSANNTVLANLPAKHIPYGAIAAGPDNNLWGGYSMESGSQTDRWALPRRAGGWTQQSNEPRLYYTAPMVYALAALNPNGTGTLTPNFPQPVIKPLEYSVTARIVSTSPTSTQLRMTLDNRTAWPARGASNLTMRYYYTLDAGASLTGVTINGHDGGVAPTVSSPIHVSGDLYYLEISWVGNPVYPMGRDNTRANTYTPANTQPNEAQFHRRTIQLTLNHNAQWNNSNDWSFAGLISTDRVTQQIPIYSGSTLINGNEPGAYDLEVWYDVNNNNVLDPATDIRLTGANQTVDFGFIEPNGSVMRNILIKNNSSAPITLFDNWSLPTGFQRAGSGNLTVPGGQTRSITIEMQGVGNAVLGGTVRIFNNGANTMENPIRINVRGVVGVAWNND